MRLDHHYICPTGHEIATAQRLLVCPVCGKPLKELGWVGRPKKQRGSVLIPRGVAPGPMKRRGKR